MRLNKIPNKGELCHITPTKGGDTMLKWFELLIISAILCYLFTNVPVLEELSALTVLGLGTSWIISDIKKPIKR